MTPTTWRVALNIYQHERSGDLILGQREIAHGLDLSKTEVRNALSVLRAEQMARSYSSGPEEVWLLTRKGWQDCARLDSVANRALCNLRARKEMAYADLEKTVSEELPAMEPKELKTALLIYREAEYLDSEGSANSRDCVWRFRFERERE
jgi:predicted ArsR family transcriptional regulator